MEMWGPGEREWGWWASGFVRNEPSSVYQGAGMERLWNAGSRKISLRKLIGCFQSYPKGTKKHMAQLGQLDIRDWKVTFFHCALRQNIWALFIISEQISNQAPSHQFPGQHWNWQRMWAEV